MKKIFFTTLLLGIVIFLSSCVKEECLCSNGLVITESEAKDSGVTLNEACDFTTKTSGSKCSLN